MAKTVTQIAMEAAIFRRTGAYRKPVIPSASQVKTFDYVSHLNSVKESRIRRTR